MEDAVFDRALKLVEEGKVKETGDGWWEVQGNEKHQVHFKGSRLTCDCSHHALHGYQGDVCAHKLAVVIKRALREIAARIEAECRIKSDGHESE